MEEKKNMAVRVGRWTGEILLVFIGVYAAFWLNNYQQHRQDAQRRDQILASLEEQLRESIASGKTSGAQEDHAAAEFHRALAAGEMPPLHPFTFTTDYNPGDTTALLQSGGIELLDVKTLMALRGVESVIRWGLSRMNDFKTFSNQLILPNLDQPITFFYDPATRKLRKRFEMYPEALDATAKFAHDLERTQTELLQRIEAERKRR